MQILTPSVSEAAATASRASSHVLMVSIRYSEAGGWEADGEAGTLKHDSEAGLSSTGVEVGGVGVGVG
jgi:hypothetical protein